MPAYRATYVGSLAGVENFSYGFHFTSPATTAANALPIATTWFNTFWGFIGLDDLFPDEVAHQQVSVSAVNTSGVADVASGAITGAGTAIGAPVPLQVAMVVSLRTTPQTVPPGPQRGRFYLPTPASTSFSSTGLFTPAVTATVADAIEAATEELSLPAQQNMTVDRVTRNTAGDITSVVSEPVTTIQVGSVPDTQRRRRNKLVEVYATRPIAIP